MLSCRRCCLLSSGQVEFDDSTCCCCCSCCCTACSCCDSNSAPPSCCRRCRRRRRRAPATGDVHTACIAPGASASPRAAGRASTIGSSGSAAFNSSISRRDRHAPTPPNATVAKRGVARNAESTQRLARGCARTSAAAEGKTASGGVANSPPPPLSVWLPPLLPLLLLLLPLLARPPAACQCWRDWMSASRRDEPMTAPSYAAGPSKPVLRLLCVEGWCRCGLCTRGAARTRTPRASGKRGDERAAHTAPRARCETATSGCAALDAVCNVGSAPQYM